jgi:RNA polymerase sigma-70 factor (ECF subfamily)
VDTRSIDELALRAQRGDRSSFDQLVARLRAPLVAFLARRLAAPHDAEDIAQEAFDRAYRSLDRYDPTRRFSTWLFAIGKNAAINFNVALARRSELERRIEWTAASVPAATGEDAAIWQRARRALGDDAYLALWLRYACDLTVHEIASELGKTVVGTKVLLHRARKKLIEEAV